MTRQRLWQLRMRAEGRCQTCGKRATTRTSCRQHAEMENKRKLAAYRTGAIALPKYLARNALAKAIRDGHLIRPAMCSRCDVSDPKINGHHHDYSKPLDVEWLCYRCHAIVDERSNTAQRPQA